jgi:hypothetical protein
MPAVRAAAALGTPVGSRDMGRGEVCAGVSSVLLYACTWGILKGGNAGICRQSHSACVQEGTGGECREACQRRHGKPA